VTAREKSCESEIDNPFLSEYDPADFGSCGADTLQRRVRVPCQLAGFGDIGHVHRSSFAPVDWHTVSLWRLAHYIEATPVQRKLRTQMSNSPASKGRATPTSAPEPHLQGLSAMLAGHLRGPGPAPYWNPPDCGDIDMRIAADGTWFYCGSPIGRAPLVRMFSSILRKEGGRYVLVTPVEKVGIKVDDAPFLAVEMQVADEGSGPQLTFRTNVDDVVTVDGEHPLRFESGASEGLKPYVRVRDDLWALVTRALFYDVVALGRTARSESEKWFGVRSSGVFFPICRASEIEGH
jgi:uncharacterized protein